MNLIHNAVLTTGLIDAEQAAARVETTISSIGAGVAVVALFVLGLVALNVVFWPRPRVGAGGGKRLRSMVFPDGESSASPSVSILVPARNEEENLPGILGSLLAELKGESSPVTEVLIYDDASTDGTAACIDAATKQDERIRRLPGSGDLPSGWYGKPNAIRHLAAEAQGDWLLLLDADTRFAVGAPSLMVAEARRREASMVSFWPRILAQTSIERWLMPMLSWVVLSLYPTPIQFLSRWRRRPALGLAHGACILVERRTYERLGGHALVRGEIFEDTALARAWRQGGESSLCLDGQDLVAVRMYESFAAIWAGFAKNFYPAFRHRASFWLFLCFHFVVFVVPFAMVLVPGVTIGWVVAALAVLGARLLLAFRFGHRISAVIAHPAAELVLLALGLVSWRRVTSGQGVDWKGRVYQPGSQKDGGQQ